MRSYYVLLGIGRDIYTHGLGTFQVKHSWAVHKWTFSLKLIPMLLEWKKHAKYCKVKCRFISKVTKVAHVGISVLCLYTRETT